MSQYSIEGEKIRWVFGWDVTYLSYFLKRYDKSHTEGTRLVFQLGNRTRELHYVEDLFTVAEMTGLDIPEETRLKLIRDKDIEKVTFYVVYFEGEFVKGLQTDNFATAELIQGELAKAKSVPVLVDKVTGSIRTSQ